MRAPDYSTVAIALRRQIETLAPAILPDGKREGAEWRGAGPDGATWCVVLRGSKQGVFLNTGAGLAGDALELVRHGLCGGDRRQAYEWALRWLGMAPGEWRPPERQADAARQADDRAAQAAADAERKRRASLRIFLNAKPFTWTDPPGLYLIGRGITPDTMPSKIRALRYYPELRHARSGRYFDAMVAAVVEPISGTHLAVHQTYLARADGVWTKAPVSPQKMVLGSFRGGLISLLRGASSKSLPQAPAGDRLILAEGIENALSLAGYFADHRVAAAVSVANLPLVQLPENIAHVMLVIDRDGENDAVFKARDVAQGLWEHAGKTVSRWAPPRGFKDANAYILGKVR